MRVDKFLKKWYNTSIRKFRGVKTMNEVTNTNGLNILFKKTTLPRYLIALILEIPKYVDAIKNYKGEYTNDSIYAIMKEVALRSLDEGTCDRAEYGAMRRVSKAVRGDQYSWVEPTDLIHKTSFSSSMINRMVGNKDFYRAIKDYDGEINDNSVLSLIASLLNNPNDLYNAASVIELQESILKFLSKDK